MTYNFVRRHQVVESETFLQTSQRQTQVNARSKHFELRLISLMEQNKQGYLFSIVQLVINPLCTFY